jgi:hypothetical protein
MSDPLKVEKALLTMNKVENGIRAEEVRSRLDPESYIEGLQELLAESRSVPVEDLQRLKFRADIYLALLRKSLPDLKSIEIIQPKGKPLPLAISFEVEDGRIDAETE